MKLGRNALCPCGSGRKVKRCCGSERTPPNAPPLPEGALAKELDPFTGSLAWN